MKRRDILKTAASGAALSWLARACGPGPKPPGPDGGGGPQPVTALTDGLSLYDDFDGNGNLQTIDGQPLAVAGLLSSRIWGGTYGTEMLENPFSSPPSAIVKGEELRASASVAAARSGYILRVTNILNSFMKVLLSNPETIDFPDFKSLSADVLLSSASMTANGGAGVDYHTTIPEQPPGKSWWADIFIVKGVSGEAFLMGHYTNINTGSTASHWLGPAELDTWYNLRLDILTRRDDASLSDEEIRLDFYVGGEYRDSLFPEDSAILLDPERTGLGPHRSLVVWSEQGSENVFGYFDNVRAVYQDRIE